MFQIYKKGLIICFTSLLIASCGSESNKIKETKGNNTKASFYSDIGDWNVPKPILTGERKKSHKARPALALIKSKMAVLYSTSKNIIFNYNGKESIIDDNGGTTKLWLYEKNGIIYALWWRKQVSGKHLYIRSSSDLGKTFSKVAIINSSTGVLPGISFSSDGKGNVTVAYYDERSPQYQIYINHSSDNGVTWNSKDTRLDTDENTPIRKVGNKDIPRSFAVNPYLITLESGKLLAIWQQRKLVDGRLRSQFVERTSIDGGKTWGKEHEIHTSSQSLAVEYNIQSKGNRVLLVAAYPKKGLLGFLATDSMASNQLLWNKLGSASGTENVNEISWLRPALSKKGAKVGFILQKGTSTKYQVQVASVDFKTNTWKDVFRLDRAKKSPVKTKATYFDLKALPNGEFVIVWEDYRSIIPVMMFDSTTGEGGSWRKKPIELTRAGLSQIKYPDIFLDSNNIWLVFEWYVLNGDRLPRPSFLQFPLDPKTGGLKNEIVAAPKPKVYAANERKNMLKQLVTKFMDHRVKKEWEKTWDMMDPVYRSVTVKRSWLYNMGYVSYEKYKLGKIHIDGVFGTVDIEMTISLPQQFREGEIMEPTPPKTQNIQTKWLWFYDQWYFYPSSSFKPHLFY